MPYEISYDYERSILMGRVYGKVTEAEIRDIDAEAFSRIKDYPKCQRVLCDVQDLETDFNAFELYRMPRSTEATAAGMNINVYAFKVAFVVSAGAEIWNFLETVSCNLGRNVKVFTDIAQAGNWLNEEGGAGF